VKNGDTQYLQDVTALAFQSVSEASYGWIFGQWQVRGRAGFEYNHHDLESSLTGINTAVFPVTNNSRLDVIALYARPKIVYENRHLRLSSYALIHYYAYCFNPTCHKYPPKRRSVEQFAERPNFYTSNNQRIIKSGF
jgi:hypothetical protein